MVGPRFLPAGESALVVEYGDTADPELHKRVLALDAAIQVRSMDGVLETVPTYRSLMIRFDPRQVTNDRLRRAVTDLVEAEPPPRQSRHWRIPACYDPLHAEDIEELARELDLTQDRIVELHAGARYKVVMYGFAPGFVFLSGLPKELHISRRATPRHAAPPGSLTIANGQALIASIAMPTGWYVVGRTPARTFDPISQPTFPIDVGDEVSFQQIDTATFDRLSREVEAGKSILEAD